MVLIPSRVKRELSRVVIQVKKCASGELVKILAVVLMPAMLLPT